MDETVTICIVHYRKLPQLKKTIQSIRKYMKVPYKIKLLNQGYLNKKIFKYLKKQEKKEDINVTLNETNTGCSPGRKQLVKGIETPYILSLDDDMYLTENCMQPVWKFFENNPKVGAIGFSIYDSGGKFSHIGGSNITINDNEVKVEKPDISRNNTDMKFVEVDNVSAGAMVYRNELKNCFEWDDNYFIGFDDLDKGLQLKLNCNWDVYVSLKSNLIHDKVSKKREETEYNKARRDYNKIKESYLHFIQKWGYRLPWKKHIFHKYLSTLPNFITREIAYLWLNR